MVKDITNDPKGSSPLRILTANLSFHNKKASAVARAALEPEPDLILLLEWTGENFDKEGVGRQGYRALVNAPQPCLPGNPKNGAYGIGIFVREPLSGNGCVIPSPIQGPSPLPWGVARTHIQDHNITVIGLHAPAPISEWTTKPTIRNVMEHVFEGKLREDFGAGKGGDSVIVTGNFNVPSFDPFLREVKKKGLKDVHSEHHYGLSPTWAPFTWFPSLLRLDYIFCSKEFNIAKSWTIKIPGSDHRAVVADLVIPDIPR